MVSKLAVSPKSYNIRLATPHRPSTSPTYIKMASSVSIPVAVIPLASSSTFGYDNHETEHQNLHLTDDLEDDDVYADEDDAQSFIQPAISPVATRLTSPHTPAAEKAAAMDRLPGGGLFDVDETGSDQPVNGNGKLPPPVIERFPTPWQAGPKRFAFMDTGSHRLPSMASVFQARVHRSSSVSENALKRLSKALPSISIPAGMMPNITTPSFLSSFGSSFQKDEQAARPPENEQAEGIPGRMNPGNLEVVAGIPSRPRSRPPTLRRSTSDDSLLYQSLSRVSSFGDDDRFAHVREQVNSRFKAIKDSWDGPNFRISQFQSTSLKRHWSHEERH